MKENTVEIPVSMFLDIVETLRWYADCKGVLFSNHTGDALKIRDIKENGFFMGDENEHWIDRVLIDGQSIFYENGLKAFLVAHQIAINIPSLDDILMEGRKYKLAKALKNGKL